MNLLDMDRAFEESKERTERYARNPYARAYESDDPLATLIEMLNEQIERTGYPEFMPVAEFITSIGKNPTEDALKRIRPYGGTWTTEHPAMTIMQIGWEWEKLLLRGEQ